MVAEVWYALMAVERAVPSTDGYRLTAIDGMANTGRRMDIGPGLSGGCCRRQHSDVAVLEHTLPPTSSASYVVVVVDITINSPHLQQDRNLHSLPNVRDR
jgi:hypothetical protein